MHPRNKFPIVAFLLIITVLGAAQTAPPPAQEPQPSPDPATSQTQSDEQVPAAAPPQQPGDTVQVPNRPPGEVEQGDSGVFVFKKEVEEVVLHATVIDQRQRLVTTLQRDDFQVFEDGQVQTITSFRREDIPVALGIVIDNSGSMRDKRPRVNQAAINLVRASNPQDQVFVVNFNDEPFLDQDFTSNIAVLKEALERIESRGGTALYDAVVAAADHLVKGGSLEKKVLLVVTDGEDNASRESLEQAIRRLQDENGPTVYTLAILGDDREARRAKRALAALAAQTGGVAFFPRDINEVDAISQAVARDIRNQYTIGYKPSNPQSRGGYRSVRVEAQAPGHGRLQVRTRSGYYAGEKRASR